MSYLVVGVLLLGIGYGLYAALSKIYAAVFREEEPLK